MLCSEGGIGGEEGGAGGDECHGIVGDVGGCRWGCFAMLFVCC